MFIDQTNAWMINGTLAGISAGCAVFVALRDALWRKNGISKRMDERIEHAQRTADCWQDSAPARELKREIDRQGQVLIAHDGCLTSVATRVDIARVEGAAKRIELMADAAAKGVDRIEGLLIKRALHGGRT